MKFQSKISGYFVYMPMEQQPDKIKSHARSPNITSAETWLQVEYKSLLTNVVYDKPKLKPTGYNRDASVFEIELLNERIVDGQYVLDCTAKLDNNWIQFDSAGLSLSQSPAHFTIKTSCGDSIPDGGNFHITDNVNYAYITRDTSLYPVFGVSKSEKMASDFVFSWTGFKSLKKLITLFLKARFFIDHPLILYNKDKMEEINEIYNDLGQIIIKQTTGDRRENTYYREYMADDKQNLAPLLHGCTPDLSYNPEVTLDDWSHPYPPFAIPPYVNIPAEGFASNKGFKESNQGVDWQRAITYENSDNAFNVLSYDSTTDLGIIANAEKILANASIQPMAWDKIEQIVSPIGGFDNVWPVILIINSNKIGINFLHPVVSSSLLGRDPLYYHKEGDGNTRQRTSTGIYVEGKPEVTTTSIVDVPDAPVERMCPCGDGGISGGIGTNKFTSMRFLILFLIIIIVVLSINEKFEPFKKAPAEISERF
jgi:hypothetical protein